jgi:sugar phosphate isomerase/epimerase
MALGMAALAAPLSPGARAAEGFFARHGLSIGLQLYTVSDAARQDLEGSFARLAKIGFRDIELAGYHGHTPAALKAAADRHGMRFTGIHLSAAPFAPDDPSLAGDIAKLAADLHMLGLTEVTLPIMLLPEGAAPAQGEGFPAFLSRATATMGRAGWQRTADFLNARAALLAREGLRLGYHNHNLEFAPVEGTTGWDVLVDGTDPALVDLELDVGWVAAAGQDPLAVLARHAGRVRQMHVKDIKASTRPNFTLQQDPTQVGDGSLPWAKLLPAAQAAGVRRFYVEQEPPFTMDRFDAITRSHRYLASLD